MKILLICVGGLSTGILMKKMKKYAQDMRFPLTINACAATDIEEISDDDYDVILLGPQISYKKPEIEAVAKAPIGTISAYDYAIGNAEGIFAQVQKILPIK